MVDRDTTEEESAKYQSCFYIDGHGRFSMKDISVDTGRRPDRFEIEIDTDDIAINSRGGNYLIGVETDLMIPMSQGDVIFEDVRVISTPPGKIVMEHNI